MAVLQIVGDRPGAGKTSLAGALMPALVQAGRQAVYYKPFSPDGDGDADFEFFSRNPLTGGSPHQGPAVPPPLTSPPGGDLDDNLLEEVQSHLTRLATQADAVLLEGPDLTGSRGEASPAAFQLSSAAASRVVLVVRYTKDLTADDISQACRSFGPALAGIIVNGVTAYRTAHVDAGLSPQLLANGLPFLGAVGEDRSMLAVSVSQVARYLDGRWVQETDNTDALVERFILGGNVMDAGPTHFGRYPNQAVVTSTARPDIQMASLSAGVCCLVLTGGGEPAEYAKAEALQRGVPMIVVDANTADTAEALGGLISWAPGASDHKVQRFLRLLRQGVDLEALTSAALG